MKYAADFRAIARDALRGKWSTAVLTGFIAALIGATIGTGSSSSVELPEDWQTNPVFQPIMPLLFTIASFLTVYAIIVMIIGGAGKLGYATFNLNLVDRKPAALSDLFPPQKNILLVGDAAQLCYTIYKDSFPVHIGATALRARWVAAAALTRLAGGQTVSASDLRPDYLQLSQAERERQKRQQQGGQTP